MVKKYGEYLYFIFRVLVGLLFFQHGAQKLLGRFGGNKVALFSLMGLAGLIELVGGLFIALGLFTRITAFIAAFEMLVAYFKAHLPQGLIPIMNMGEPALLFFASSLVLITYGPGKWSLGIILFKKG